MYEHFYFFYYFYMAYYGFKYLKNAPYFVNF